jgi:hypothetical protein
MAPYHQQAPSVGWHPGTRFRFAPRPAVRTERPGYSAPTYLDCRVKKEIFPVPPGVAWARRNQSAVELCSGKPQCGFTVVVAHTILNGSKGVSANSSKMRFSGEDRISCRPVAGRGHGEPKRQGGFRRDFGAGGALAGVAWLRFGVERGNARAALWRPTPQNNAVLLVTTNYSRNSLL